MVHTLGEVTVPMGNTDIKFQVVTDRFPVKTDGILDIKFLTQQEAVLQFKNQLPSSLRLGDKEFSFDTHISLELPPRTKKLIDLPIKNSDKQSGYIRRINAGPGVYLGEVLAKQKGGVAKVFAINSTTNHVTLTLSPVELEDFSTVPSTPEKTRVNDPMRKNSQEVAQRLVKLAKLLKLSHLNEAEKTSVFAMVSQFPYQLYLPGDKLGSTTAAKHTLFTTDEIPINTKQYRFPVVHREEIKKQVQDLLANEIISPSTSPYNSPLWIVPKKADSSGNPRWRMVIDYRALNEKTISDAYPLPNITDILDQLGGAKYFSTLDLASGFHQIPMEEKSKHKTAFSTPFGFFEFNKMPFGLKNAPATFQRMMDMVLSGLQGVELFVYMDDIVIYASSLEEHAQKLKTLLARLRDAGLTLQPDKCHFLRRELIYLGHQITDKGVKPDPGKIEAVKNFPVPKTR